MSENNNKNSCQLDQLLQTLSQRLGTDPDTLKSAAQKGDIGKILKGISDSDASRIQKALSDQSTAKKILSSSQAQILLKNLMGDK